MNQKKCACKGSFLDKFIQPSILIELSEQNKNSSDILKSLNQGTMAKYGKIDPAGFYRMLKKMEDAGTISSEWLTSDHERPVKIYAITHTGKVCLTTWQYTLKQYLKDMGELLEQIVAKTK